MLPSMNECYTGQDRTGRDRKETNRSAERKPYSLCHLPLSYSFVEGTNDAPLHE